MPLTLRSRSFQLFKRLPDSNNNLAQRSQPAATVTNQQPVKSSKQKALEMVNNNSAKDNRSKVNFRPQSELLFDLRMFKTNVARLMLSSPNGISSKERTRLERQCACSLVFVRESHSMDPLRNPLWILFINIVALDYLRSCFFGIFRTLFGWIELDFYFKQIYNQFFFQTDPLLNPQLLRSLSIAINPLAPLQHAIQHQSRLVAGNTRSGHHRHVFSHPPKSSGSSSDHSCESSSGYSGNSSDSLTCNRDSGDREAAKFCEKKIISPQVSLNAGKDAGHLNQPSRAKSHPPLRKLSPLDGNSKFADSKGKATNVGDKSQMLPSKVAVETVVFKSAATAPAAAAAVTTNQSNSYDGISTSNVRPTTTRANRLLRLLVTRRKCHVPPALPPPRVAAVILSNEVGVGRRAESVDRLHLLHCVGASVGSVELQKQTSKFLATKTSASSSSPPPPSIAATANSTVAQTAASTAAVSADINSEKVALQCQSKFCKL